VRPVELHMNKANLAVRRRGCSGTHSNLQRAQQGRSRGQAATRALSCMMCGGAKPQWAASKCKGGDKGGDTADTMLPCSCSAV
jgi:hypothetical protein